MYKICTNVKALSDYQRTGDGYFGMKRKKGYDKSVYRSLGLIAQFGINMLVPICMLTALGIFLDDKLDTSFWVVLLFPIGALAGGQNIYRMAKQIYAAPREKKRKKELSGRNADGGEIEKDK